MLDWVVVDVIDMSAEVVIVLDGVFPVAFLPEQVFAARGFVDFDALRGQVARDVGFDAAPSCRVVVICRRECPNGV